MTTAQRLFSLSMLGGAAMMMAPLASAQGPFQDLTEDQRQAIRSDLEECRDTHDDHESRKACADEVFADHGVERPERHDRRGRGRKMGHKFRSQIVETCGEREDAEQWRECAKEARSGLREQFQEEHPQAFERFQNRRERRSNFREQLKVCLDLTDHSSLRACVIKVRDAIREQAQN